MPEPLEVTRLLQRLGDGDARAADELLPAVYDELHRLAERAMRQQRSGHTLQTTALVNEAWMRLVGTEDAGWEGRNHFLAVAARAMRSVLVDHARRRGAQKRGDGGARVDLDEALGRFEARADDMLALDEALEELGGLDEILPRIVELRFFAGLSHPEIAEVLETSLRSVERGWSTARAWLFQRLRPAPEGS